MADLLIVGALVLSPLPLSAIVDWRAAFPRLLVAFSGFGLVAAAGRLASFRGRVWLVAVAVVGILVPLVAAAASLATDWPERKLVTLDALYRRIPLVLTGFSPTTDRGGIHPNQLGGVLCLLVPLTFGTALSAPSAWQRARLLRLGLFVVAIGLSFLLVLTQSRSALMGIVIGGSLGALVHWSVARRPLVALTIVTGLLLVVGGLFTSWLLPEATGRLDTLPGRLELWGRALLMIQDFPLTGIGVGRFSSVLHALYPPASMTPGAPVPHAHSLYLQLALDFGLPVAILFLALVAVLLWRLGRATSGDHSTRSIGIALRIGIVSYLIYGLTDSIGLGSWGGIPFWLILALARFVGQGSPKLPAGTGTPA